MRTIAAVAVAMGAAAALTACTSGPAQPAPTSSATTGIGSAATPATRPPATTIEEVSKTTEAEVDWAKITYREFDNCPKYAGPGKDIDETEVDYVRHADLTGDGRNETIVSASCQASTAGNPTRVFVYNGVRKILDIGKGYDLMSTDARADGRTLTVHAKALSKKAARCCPDLAVTFKYRWNGSGFTTVSVTQKPLAVAGAPWPDVDWAKVVAPHLQARAKVVNKRFADVTGDDIDDAIITARRASDVGENPLRVFVYDGKKRIAPYRLLLTVSKEDYIVKATVTPGARTLTVTAEGRRPDGTRTFLELKYRWDGHRFVLQSRTQR